MAEQKQQQKERNIAKEILKWIGLAVLSLLLILAIVFQATWKVITLLSIVLTACTILPKPARKWFWVSLAAIVVVLIIWVFLPDDDEGWRPYTFDGELAALEAQYAIRDEENAALMYDELFETMDADPYQPEFFVQSSPSSVDELWLSNDHPEMAQWLNGYQSTIERLLQAAEKDKCRFPVGADPASYGWHVERSTKMLRCTWLLLSAGNNDMAEGRIDAGLEKYLCIIRMADHLNQQPVMTDFLAGFAIEDWALTQLNRFLIEGQPGGEQVQLISTSIGCVENNWGADFIRVLEYRKLFRKNAYCRRTYQVNSTGKTRLTREVLAPARMLFPRESWPPTYSQRKRYKAKTILAWFFKPSTPQKAAEIIDASFEKYYAMAEPDFDWPKQPEKLHSVLTTKMGFTRGTFDYKYIAQLAAAMSEESYYGVHDMYLRNLALRRGSRLLTAIKQYYIERGGWPETLEDVKAFAPAEIFVDPTNGDFFVYKLTRENFTLYSKGKNKIDEDGIRRVTSEPNDYGWSKTEEDDILIWPTQGRKTPQKNAKAE